MRVRANSFSTFAWARTWYRRNPTYPRSVGIAALSAPHFQTSTTHCSEKPAVQLQMSTPEMSRVGALLALLVPRVLGHGQITYPPSTSHGGSLAEAGRCDSTACMWFSQPTSIPGPPTVNERRHRTFNVDVSSGTRDWSRTMPWRAPGTAPILGSGCGTSGGGPVPLANGGKAAPSMPPQGSDGVHLPRQPPTEWRRGSVQEVAWAINANHGGGCETPAGAEP